MPAASAMSSTLVFSKPDSVNMSIAMVLISSRVVMGLRPGVAAALPPAGAAAAPSGVAAALPSGVTARIGVGSEGFILTCPSG